MLESLVALPHETAHRSLLDQAVRRQDPPAALRVRGSRGGVGSVS